MMSMTVYLGVFIAVVVLNVLGLGVDLALDLSHLTTITHLAREHTIFGLLIILVETIGVAALALHFWNVP